jgi:shikimate dehydrogenase
MNRTGSQLRLAVIGHPVKHSLSPIMQILAAREAGYGEGEFFYGKIDVPPQELPRFMREFRSGPLAGLNVTIPHKLAVMEFLDKIDPQAKAIGAVNVVVKEGSILAGYNTDAYGLMKSIKDIGGVDSVAGKKVFVYGAGGAARAAVSGFCAEGAASLVIANRTRQRAEELIARLRLENCSTRSLGFDDRKTLVESVAVADIIVNATSVGMAGGAAHGGIPPGVEGLREGQVVVDIVYHPLETEFLAEARARGAKVVDGLWMLVFQGAKAFEMWTGREFPVDKARPALLAELGEGRL